jgi:drug/metabolite transporter (DMT)-like permease
LTKIHHSHRFAYLALCAVCLFWGTTYLGIRIALETLPPAYLIGIRYLISGAILLPAMLIVFAGIGIVRW